MGTIPPELWNRLATAVIPKLRSGSDIEILLRLSVTVSEALAGGLQSQLAQVLRDLGIADKAQVRET